MSNALIIVESPAKAKTIINCLTDDGFKKNSLHDNIQVLATYGQVRSLKAKDGGIDVENDFLIDYQIVEKSRKHVEEIATALAAQKETDTLYLATNPDYEGESLAAHLLILLNEHGCIGDEKIIKRLTLNTINPFTLQAAFETADSFPNTLSQHAINAQHAKTALDYLFNFNLSPLLWKKIRQGLSTGREQISALHLIVKREREIESFVAKEYWEINCDLVFTKSKAKLTAKAKEESFTAKLTHYQKTTLTQFSVDHIDITEAIDTTLSIITKGKLTVTDIKKERVEQQQPIPFITNTLLQEAYLTFGFTAMRTMRTLQQLFDGIDLSKTLHIGDGELGSHVSLISYFKTNATALPENARTAIQHYIQETYDQKAIDPIEEAETTDVSISATAIYPASINILPKKIKRSLTADQFKLYHLIWKRSIASLMPSSITEITTIDFDAVQGVFQTQSAEIIEAGFTSVYETSTVDESPLNSKTPPLKKGDEVHLLKINSTQHFTDAPERFSEGTLLESLKTKNIGQPASYASIISSLQNWEYIEQENKKFYPTDVGFVVNKFLCQHLLEYVYADFTATMDAGIHTVSTGKIEWTAFIDEFWQPFSTLIKNKTDTVERKDVTQEVLDEHCPKCNELLSIRLGNRGKFIGCTTYPICDYTRNLDDNKNDASPNVIDGRNCPECQSNLIIKQGRYGKFVGCSSYPKCKHMEPLDKPEDSGIQCPECKKGSLLKRNSRNGKVFYSCSSYPGCKYAVWNPPISESCPDCGWPILISKTSKRHGAEKACPQKSCKFSAIDD